jgi:hypothetical protein
MLGAVLVAVIRKTGLVASLGAALVLATLVLAHTASPTARQHPRLKLERTSPAKVTGAHFRAHERVRLVLRRPDGAVRRRTRANGSGRFSAAFADVVLDRCRGFSITATGSSGSRARIVRRALPECAPL